MANPEWTDPLAWEDRPDSIPAPVAAALLAVVDAVRDYLPPDGISEQECLNRVIGAVDNSDINPFIREIEDGRS
jgi:hypothetical protein